MLNSQNCHILRYPIKKRISSRTGLWMPLTNEFFDQPAHVSRDEEVHVIVRVLQVTIVHRVRRARLNSNIMFLFEVHLFGSNSALRIILIYLQ